MVFYSFFKALVGFPVSVVLKNDTILSGELQAVDQFLNFRLTNITVSGTECPALSGLKTAFVRGSAIRYVELPKDHVNVPLLEEATRRVALANV
ncbi:hypothetical protein RCL1_001807 [Eukaryota sp. TZLM3-RCL]